MKLNKIKKFFSSRNSKVLDGYIRVLGGHATSSFFSFLLNYIAAAKLGPSLWGLWQQAVILQRSLSLSSLGTADYLTRELALKDDGISRSDKEDIEISGSLALSFFVLFIFNTLVYLNLSIFEENLFVPLIMIMSFTTMLSIFSGNVLVGERQTINYSLFLFATAFIHALGIFLILRYEIQGFSIWIVLVSLGPALIGFYFVKYKWFNRNIFKSLLTTLSSAKHFFFASVLAFLAYFVDRIMVVNLFGADNLGVYSLALLVATPLLLVMSASDKIFYPMIVNRYGFEGDTDNATSFSLLYLKICLPLSFSFIFILTALFLLISPVFFSSYNIDYVVLSNTVISYAFLYICSPGASALAAIGKMNIYNRILLGQIIFVTLFATIGSKSNIDMLGISLIILFANFFVLVACSLMGIFNENRLALQKSYKMLLACIVVIFSLVIFNLSLKWTYLNYLGENQGVIFNLLIAAIFMVILTYIEVKGLIEQGVSHE